MNKFLEIKLNQLNYYAHTWLQVIQKILLTLMLTVIYFLGIGFTFLLLPIFGKELIKKFNPVEENGSYWKDADNYNGNSMKELEKQV